MANFNMPSLPICSTQCSSSLYTTPSFYDFKAQTSAFEEATSHPTRPSARHEESCSLHAKVGSGMNDCLTAKFATLIHELRQVREDFRFHDEKGMPLHESLLSSHPSSYRYSHRTNQDLHNLIGHQASQLATRERELAKAQEDARILRTTLLKVTAERDLLARQISEFSFTRSEISTLDVLQKELTKLKQHFDTSMVQLGRSVLDRFAPDATDKTPCRSSPDPIVQTAAPPFGKGREDWTANPASSQPKPHALDHPDDCQCSFACLQWREYNSELCPHESGPSIFCSAAGSCLMQQGLHLGDCRCLLCTPITPASTANIAHAILRSQGDERAHACTATDVKATKAWICSALPAQRTWPKAGTESSAASQDVSRVVGASSAGRSPLNDADRNEWTAPLAPSLCPTPLSRR